MKCSLLKSVFNPKGIEVLEIKDVYNKIIGNDYLQATTACHAAYTYMLSAKDHKEKKERDQIYEKEHKLNLECAIFSGVFKEKKNTECVEYNACITFDIDNIYKDEDYVKIKKYFLRDLSTVLIFRSPSGHGMKVVQLLNYNGEEIIRFHNLAYKYLKEKHNSKLKKIGNEYLIGADGSKQSDIARGCFLSCDIHAYYNENPMPAIVELEFSNVIPTCVFL